MGFEDDDGDVPKAVGPYRIVEPLGEGASGRVYHAIHQDLLMHVALKILETGPGTPVARVERFKREAQTAARLRHSNIVGADDRRHWIAMDLEPARSLGEWLRDVRSFRHRSARSASARRSSSCSTSSADRSRSGRTAAST